MGQLSIERKDELAKQLGSSSGGTNGRWRHRPGKTGLTDHDEILRLRDRQHDLASRVVGLEHVYRDQATELRRLRRAQAELQREIDSMTKADELAAAVAAALRKDRRFQLTLTRAVAGGILAVLVAVPAVHDLAHWLGWG